MLPYMGVVAILVMWTIGFEHIFVPSAPGGSKWDLFIICSVALRRCLKLSYESPGSKVKQ